MGRAPGTGDRGIKVARHKGASWDSMARAEGDGKAAGGFWVGWDGFCKGLSVRLWEDLVAEVEVRGTIVGNKPRVPQTWAFVEKGEARVPDSSGSGGRSQAGCCDTWEKERAGGRGGGRGQDCVPRLDGRGDTTMCESLGLRTVV